MDSPDATDADRTQFQSWLAASPTHAEAYREARKFWSALGLLSTKNLDSSLLRPSTRERWTALTDRLSGAFPARYVGATAGGTIALVLLLGAALLLGTPEPVGPSIVTVPVVSHYATEVGETETLTLRDGTTITLGAASAIESSMSRERRVVRLIDGTAFFDVEPEPDRPFSVTAGELTATVTGTAFEVRSSDEILRVAVAEGSVEVSHPLRIADRGTSVVSTRSLSAGQQVAADAENGLAEVKPVDLQTVGAWRNDRLIYNGASLAELIADANRYTDVPVEIPANRQNIGELRVRGAFDARDIGGMLSALAEIHPVVIDRSDPAVVRIRPLMPAD